MNLIMSDYSGSAISFDEDGWFNATEAATRFGKRPNDWLSLDETKAYIEALTGLLITSQNGNYYDHKVTQNHFVKTRRGRHGSGTWLHPKLAVAFARWLDVRFAIWCDLQIDQILRGNHPHFDWKKMRSEAASSFKVMNEAVKLVREGLGKKTEWFHYANEARLVNFALAGKSASLDRESLSESELALLAKLETRNAVWVAQGIGYQVRKETLCLFAAEALVESGRTIEAAA